MPDRGPLAAFSRLLLSDRWRHHPLRQEARGMVVVLGRLFGSPPPPAEPVPPPVVTPDLGRPRSPGPPPRP